MTSLAIREAVHALSGLGGEFALVHEAALTVFGIDVNIVPYGIDVFAPSGLSGTIPGDIGGIPMRVWTSLPGVHGGIEDNCIWNEVYEVWVLDPELVLQNLVLSPDIEYIWEQRAALAMLLYADEMTNEELMEYDRHVRGV